MTITGNIESIEYRNTAGHEKKVVTIIPDHRQRAFVEFRGRKMDDLHGLKENDEIQVSVMLEGKISKNSGIQYNNFVAQNVMQVIR
ncbi:hypothetical protein FUA48_11245 [Flavobacterium alkalisoli]|uniref:DUF3127 domain-containing protein n=1 Tax=Flavobacterium alkalisoli TaxID=2602769 RepID=A0A5B9FT32_9FLAO|nr:hypothetical protein [Flavobacterium alkalisoli]QEE50135.1 hypothetical protein FUA48_11245 [Flavobacterium alkalisoli]